MYNVNAHFVMNTRMTDVDAAFVWPHECDTVYISFILSLKMKLEDVYFEKNKPFTYFI